MQPLTDLLNVCHTKQPFHLFESACTAFTTVKSALATKTLLRHPVPRAPYSLMTDASNIAVGAVLQQYINGTWHPLSFFSKRLQPSETKYSTFGKELLAVYLSIRHFRHILEGLQFFILTDHKPLIHAISSASSRHLPREIRHLDFISQFTTDIQHIKGIKNSVADALSRLILILSIHRSISPNLLMHNNLMKNFRRLKHPPHYSFVKFRFHCRTKRLFVILLQEILGHMFQLSTVVLSLIVYILFHILEFVPHKNLLRSVSFGLA